MKTTYRYWRNPEHGSVGVERTMDESTVDRQVRHVENRMPDGYEEISKADYESALSRRDSSTVDLVANALEAVATRRTLERRKRAQAYSELLRSGMSSNAASVLTGFTPPT